MASFVSVSAVELLAWTLKFRHNPYTYVVIYTHVAEHEAQNKQRENSLY
jgi:hypothetical protein